MNLILSITKSILWIIWGIISWLDTRIFFPWRKLWVLLVTRTNDYFRKKRIPGFQDKNHPEINERIRSWVLNFENDEIREMRQRFTSVIDEESEFKHHSIISVYETLRLYTLTNKWSPPVKHFHFVIAFLVLSSSVVFSFYYLITHVLARAGLLKYDITFDVLAGIISLMCLVGGVFLFTSTFLQTEGEGRALFILILALSVSYWFIVYVILANVIYNSLNTFVILSLFFGSTPLKRD